VLLYNYTFFTNTLNAYSYANNQGFILSLPLVLFGLTALVLILMSSRLTTKPVLIIVLIISSMTSYFMNTYNTVIDDDMIRNMMQTDVKETMDLVSLKQVLYLVLLGLIPAYFVYKVPLNYRSFKRELFSKIKYSLFFIVLMLAAIFMFSKHYTSFVREHKPLRYSTNPTYWIYSTGLYIYKTFNSGPIIVKQVGRDAKVNKQSVDTPKLVILVVGEATRADHFSYNGYERETTPLLKQENIINFSNVHACGTSTAVSVPCMFSLYDKDEFSYKKGISNENVLDVLSHTKAVSLLWRDNNSDSKGVALRVPYEDYRWPDKNTICNQDECRDVGMLAGLEKYIKQQKNNDILIVLHQMGNHGPSYYKRYPKEYEKFTPVCETNQLEECTQEEISNAYDNAILYTDYFLSKTIALLKQHNSTHQTAMIYMSDHGESLGEKGIYLHGLPYFMAPSAQTHIPAMMWLGDSFHTTLKIGEMNTKERYSQDNLFHTLLGLFDVETEVYKSEMDIFKTKD